MNRRIVLTLICLLSACGNIGSRFVKTETVGAKGGLVQVTTQDEPQIAGTELAIAAGSLGKETVITVDLVTTALLSADLVAGPTVEWGPSGTLFSSPAEMQLPYVADAQDEIFVQVEEANGQRFQIDASAVSVDVNRKLVRFRVNGFTRFQVGARRQCSATNACATGKTCRSGRCAATCTTSAQCDTNQACVAGACQSRGGSCVSNAQCLTNQACLGNQCVVFSQIDAGHSVDKPAIDAGSANACSSNSQCATNQVCLQGACEAQQCTENSQCALGNTCSFNVCVPTGAFDGGEPEQDGGIDYDGGVGDGGIGQYCLNNSQCAANTFCGTDFQCHEVACLSSWDCGQGQYCASNGNGTGVCQISDGGIDGGVFDGGHSTEDGGIDSGIDGGLDSDGGKPPTCTENTQCATGQHCINNTCQ